MIQHHVAMLNVFSISTSKTLLKSKIISVYTLLYYHVYSNYILPFCFSNLLKARWWLRFVKTWIIESGSLQNYCEIKHLNPKGVFGELGRFLCNSVMNFKEVERVNWFVSAFPTEWQ